MRIIMRNVLLAATAALSLTAAPAFATIVITAGNTPDGSLEQTIQFESPVTGTTFTGDTNQTGTPVIFDTTFTAGQGSLGGNGTSQVLMGQGVGQSHLTCVSGCIDAGGGQLSSLTNSLEMKPSAGTAWTDVIGNPDFGTGTVNIYAHDQFGNNQDLVLGPGQNFFTIRATNGEVITDVQLTMVGGVGGWNDFQQPRVSGVCTLTSSSSCTPIPTPEPGTLAVLGLGLLGLGAVAVRRRR